MKNFYFWMLTLLCSTIAFGQLSENFESDITTRGWSLYQTDSSDPGFVLTTAESQSGNASYYHNDEFVDNESTAYMVSPAYTVQSGDEFSAYVRQNYSVSYYNYSGIAISNASGDPIANPADFVEVWEAGAGFAEDSWEQVVLALDAYVGQSIYVAFVYTGDFDHEFYVDNMYIGTPCTAPVASLTTTAACDTGSYNVNVDISSLGTASSLIVSDDQGNSQTANATGALEFGPYASGTDVTFTLADADNSSCNTALATTYLCPPDNDDCANASLISSFPHSSSEDATGATQEDFVYCGPDGSNDGVWYLIEGESAQFTINVTSTGWDAAITLLSGACGELTCIDFEDNVASNNTETISFIGQVGVNYYLNVGAYSANADLPEGAFELEITSDDIPCGSPANLAVAATTDLSTDVTWQGAADNASYDLVWGATGFTPGASASASGLGDSPYTITGLTPETTYDLYVRGNCNPGFSEWVGPVTFTTLEEGAILAGTDCIHPINVISLPYTTTDNTSNYGDDYDGGQGSNCGSSSQYYLTGDDVVYAYTPTEDTSIDISMTPTGTWSGIFVYENCSDIGVACMAGVADSSTTERLIEELILTGGQTYYIVISTWASPQTVGYTLNITENTCISGTYEISTTGACETNEFMVNVDITDMGDLTQYVISDDQGSASQTATGNGTYTFGPYESLTDVTINLVANDENCNESETITYRCPGPGDNCDNPLIVDSLPYTTEDDTANYTDEYYDGGQGTNCGTGGQYYLNGNDVVYSYTPESDTSIDISLLPTGTYAGMFVYESCDDIGVNCAAGGTNSFSSDEILVEEFIVTAGQTYYILISTWASPQTVAYTLNITENTCISGSFEFNAIGACETDEYNVEVVVDNMGSLDSYEVTDSQGSEMQTITEPGTYTFGPYDQGNAVTFDFVANDLNCNFTETINYFCPAPNDECENAIEAPVNSDFSCDLVVSGSTIGATASAQEDDVVGTPNNDVWFSFEAEATSHRVTLQNIVNLDGGTTTDMAMGVYDATNGCEALVFVDDSDPNTLNLSGLTVGTTYLVRVYNWSSTVASHSFDLCIGTPPSSDYDIECGTPLEMTYCYDSNENFTWNFVSTTDEPVTIQFNAGGLEDNYDVIQIYDGDVLLWDSYNANPDGTRFDLTGTVFTAMSGSLHLSFTSDGSITCQDTSDIDTWDFTVECGSEIPMVDWANLEGPESGAIEAGDEFIVYGQVYVEGVTETDGPSEDIYAFVGYSTTDTDPETWEDWVPATFSSQEGDNDEYMADLGAALPRGGTYYYAMRYRLDWGPYYYGGYNSGEWDGTTNVSGILTAEAPPGTICSSAIPVTDLPYTTTDDTANYGDDYDGGQGTNCGSTSQYYLNGDDVVYAYTPTEDTSINISMLPTNTWSGLFVYDSCENIGVECLAGVSNTSSDERLIEDFLVTAGQTYYIVISTWASPQSTGYTLNITENTCVGIEYTTATIDQCETGEYSVTIDITSFGSSESVIVSDDQGSAEQTLSEPGTLTFGPYTEGNMVEFSFVTDDENCYETTSVGFSCPAANDDCIDATPLVVGSVFTDNPVLANNIGATDFENMPAPGCAGYQGGEVWFSVVVPASGNIIIETRNSDMDSFNDSGMAVYSGTCEALALMGCNDDGGDGLFSKLEFNDLTPGETLYVAVWEYWNDITGTFLVSAHDESIVEPCVAPTYTTTTTLDCEAGEYMVNFNFTDLGSSESIELSDDQGGTVVTLTEAGEYSVGPFTAGTEVVVSVNVGDEECNSTETFLEICETPTPPANDECIDAIELTVGETFEEGMQTGTNVDATDSDVADPSCGSYQGGDVWYMVTVPDGGTVYVETQSTGSNVTTTGMAAYSGTCGDLTEMMCEVNDGGFAMISASDLIPGDVFYIRVWSNDGATGTFNISAWSDNMGVADVTGANAVKLFPNPTSSVLNIDGMEIKTVQVYSADGKLIHVKTNNNVVDTRSLSTGTYIIRLTDVEGNVVLRKFIKK